jgi:hypothetical protein
MKKNLGKPDKIIRFTLAVILMTLLVTHTITGYWTIIFGWLFTATFILTAIDGTCPLYALLHISTCPKTSNRSTE